MFENLIADTPAAPSLNALNAFEAMARTGRATLAAEELCVTHSAVSRQVKALEARLGVRLFEGPRHDLKLTEAGRDLLPGLTAGFDAVDLAVLRAQASASSLIVAANPSIAVKWLVPRLAGFAALRPNARIELVELATHALSQRGAHVAVRIVGEPRMTPQVTPFMPNFIGPVAAAGLKLDRETPRLAARTHPAGWARWAELSGEPPPTGPVRALPHLHVVIEAAIAGLGAAVLPWGLIADDVDAGRLGPLGRFVQDGAFGFIADPRAETAVARAFKRWLLDEGAGMRRPPDATPTPL